MAAPLLRFRLVPIGVALGLLPACTTTTLYIYQCTNNGHCTQVGEGGVCEPEGFCSFPDETCPLGKRWHALADRDFANQCVGEAGAASSGSTTGEPDGTESSTTQGETETSAGSTSTTTPDPSTTDTGEVSTTDGEDTSTGPAVASCTELFGGLSQFILCEETATSCRFTAVLGGVSCNDTCAGAGQTCIQAIRNASNVCEESEPGGTCDEQVNDQICVCSRS